MQDSGPLPTDSAARKTYPLYRGLFQYFPRALAAVAHHSYIGNDKHNPGEPLHWARGKSNDQADCLLRHVMEDDWVAVAWRALAKLELVLEEAAEPDCPEGDYKLIPELEYDPASVAFKRECGTCRWNSSRKRRQSLPFCRPPSLDSWEPRTRS
jgi:hypothetical protein